MDTSINYAKTCFVQTIIMKEIHDTLLQSGNTVTYFK